LTKINIGDKIAESSEVVPFHLFSGIVKDSAFVSPIPTRYELVVVKVWPDVEA